MSRLTLPFLLLAACGDGPLHLGEDDTGSEPGCVDQDGDGFGDGCSAGADCDDGEPACTDDCSDGDSSGQADCAEGVGDGVLLYNGNGGGGWDIYEDDLAALYAGAGIPADISAIFPADIAGTYGVLEVLSPTGGFSAELEAAGRALLLRGGRVVVVTEHSGYADHEGASAYLAALGSSLRSLITVDAGDNELSLGTYSPLTDGVGGLTSFYNASIELGSGVAIGTSDIDEVVVAAEPVARGDVVLVTDGSMFGYAIDWADNAVFLLNLASLD